VLPPAAAPSSPSPPTQRSSRHAADGCARIAASLPQASPLIQPGYEQHLFSFSRRWPAISSAAASPPAIFFALPPLSLLIPHFHYYFISQAAAFHYRFLSQITGCRYQYFR